MVLVAVAGCTSSNAPDDPASGPDGGSLVVRAGEGGFAMEPPRRPGRWWASYAFPMCVEGGEPVEITAAEIAETVEPLDVEYRLLTYPAVEATAGERVDITRGGFLLGRPRQVQRGGDDVIQWDGLTRGSVAPLIGARVSTRCDADPGAVGQYVVVSLRVDPDAGAAVNGLTLTYDVQGQRGVSSPTQWEMIACGGTVAQRAEFAESCG